MDAGSAELKKIAAELGNLPHAILTDPAAVAERHAGGERLQGQPGRAVPEHAEVAAAIDAEVQAVNADPDRLDDLLQRQNYRLAYWGTAAEELSYRRFFDIDQLAALRVEREAVFEDVHRLLVKLVTDGSVDGLRIDHVDGLADPEGYLTRLRAATGRSYIVVEKILGPDEQLPGSWPVAGTSGYGFLNLVNKLFIDPAGEQEILAGYSRFTGQDTDFAEIAARRQARGHVRGPGVRDRAADRAARRHLRAAPPPARLHPPGTARLAARGPRRRSRSTAAIRAPATRSRSPTGPRSRPRSPPPGSAGPTSMPSCSTSSVRCCSCATRATWNPSSRCGSASSAPR